MIAPEIPAAPEEVSRHYDDLDRFYRQLWGSHLHHGLWRPGIRSAREAVLHLIQSLGDRLELKPGMRICDAGCGYGAGSRLLADSFGVQVSGWTLSLNQWAFGNLHFARPGRVEIFHGNWLHNALPAEAMDAIVFVESSEHMPAEEAVQEAHRVLRPHGRLGICAWASSMNPSLVARQVLLEPICREGRLKCLLNASDYRKILEQYGFNLLSLEDVTARVRRTWSLCFLRLIRALCQSPECRNYVFNKAEPNRVFARTVLRIWLAFYTGAMRYFIIIAEKRATDFQSRPSTASS